MRTIIFLLAMAGTASAAIDVHLHKAATIFIDKQSCFLQIDTKKLDDEIWAVSSEQGVDFSTATNMVAAYSVSMVDQIKAGQGLNAYCLSRQ